MKQLQTILSMLFAVMLIACSSEPNSQQPEEVQINNYIKANHPQAEPEMNGMYIIKEISSEGEQATPGTMVSVHYEGRFLDGKIFDSSYQRNQPFSFVLGAGKVIAGWEQGISALRVGEKAELIIPSYLAYGNRQVGPIPANSPLAFTVELISVQH